MGGNLQKARIGQAKRSLRNMFEVMDQLKVWAAEYVKEQMVDTPHTGVSITDITFDDDGDYPTVVILATVMVLGKLNVMHFPISLDELAEQAVALAT